MQDETQGGEQYARLSQLDDYRVSDEDPDPRGWSVLASDGTTIGTVEDLIIDTSAMKVRYLDITVTDGAAAGGGRARIPASRVDLDADQRTVVTDLGRADLSAFLSGGGDAVATAGADTYASTERSSANAGMALDEVADTSSRSGVERITRAEEELHVGTRQKQAGEVVVTKHVETERVSVPVQRRVEHVRVERRPVNDATGRADIREGEIRVPITEEEIVVEKRPVIKEEIVLTREVATETEQVEADVRRERVDISGDEALVAAEAAMKQRTAGGNRG